MVRSIPRTKNTMHVTPGFICGGAVDFALAALYLPIHCHRNCYPYGGDWETTEQFTIRRPSIRSLRIKPTAETGYSGLRFTRLETLIANEVFRRMLDRAVLRSGQCRTPYLLVQGDRNRIRSRTAHPRRGSSGQIPR